MIGWRDIEKSVAEDMIRHAKTVSPRDWDELEIVGEGGCKAMLWMPVLGSPKVRTLSADEARIGDLEADLHTVKLFLDGLSLDPVWGERAKSIRGILS